MVFRVDPAPIPGCTPAVGQPPGQILCHKAVGAVSEPNDAWARRMASLLLWKTKYRSEPFEPELKPDIGVRFESDSSVTQVLFSLRFRRLRIASNGVPGVTGSFAEWYYPFLSVIEAALPDDPEVKELVTLEVKDRAWVAAEQGAAYQGGDPGGATSYDTAPVPRVQVTPRYPEFAKEAQIQGVVILRVFVSDRGRVSDLRVVKSVKGLDEAAISAVKQWEFTPASRNGLPVGAWIDIPIDFHF